MKDKPASSIGQTSPENPRESASKLRTIYDAESRKNLRLVQFDHWFTVSRCLHHTWEAEQAWLVANQAQRGLNGIGDRVTVHHAEGAAEWLFIEREGGGFAVSLVSIPLGKDAPFPAVARWLPLEPAEGELLEVDPQDD